MKFGKFSLIAHSAALRAKAAIFIFTKVVVDLVLGLLALGPVEAVPEAGVGAGSGEEVKTGNPDCLAEAARWLVKTDVEPAEAAVMTEAGAASETGADAAANLDF